MESTATIQLINGQPHRLWKGKTDTEVPVHVYVRTLSPQTHDPDALERFDRELKALPPPEPELVSFDWRMVLP